MIKTLKHAYEVKTHFSGKFASIPFKVKKLVSSLGDAANEEFEAYQALLDSQFMLMALNDVKTYFSKGTCNTGCTQLDHAATLEGLVAHQV